MMCMPNEPDELERVMRDSKVVDWFISELTRSPRASGATRSLAPSLPDAGSGADSQLDFNRDAQATGV